MSAWRSAFQKMAYEQRIADEEANERHEAEHEDDCPTCDEKTLTTGQSCAECIAVMVSDGKLCEKCHAKLTPNDGPETICNQCFDTRCVACLDVVVKEPGSTCGACYADMVETLLEDK